MVLPRKTKDIVLSVILLGLPILFLQANLKDPIQTNVVDRVLLRISSPIQAGVTFVVAKVHRGWRRYVYLVGLQEENELLVAENMTIKRKLKEAERKLVRLDRYEKLLSFRKARKLETIGARVIGRSTSPFIRTLRVRIDRGSDDIKPGLPVVSTEGVVGRVGKTYGQYSEIILAVDPNISIDVITQRTGGRGILKGKDARNRYLCKLDFLLRREEIKVGDLIVTSGAVGIFPRDLPIGRVINVNKRSYGLYQEVEVLPIVDFSAIEEVLIILSPPPKEAPQTPTKQLPAHGVLP